MFLKSTPSRRIINAAAMISNTYAEIMGSEVYLPTNARAASRTAIHRVVFFGAEVLIFFLLN